MAKKRGGKTKLLSKTSSRSGGVLAQAGAGGRLHVLQPSCLPIFVNHLPEQLGGVLEKLETVGAVNQPRQDFCVVLPTVNNPQWPVDTQGCPSATGDVCAWLRVLLCACVNMLCRYLFLA